MRNGTKLLKFNGYTYRISQYVKGSQYQFQRWYCSSRTHHGCRASVKCSGSAIVGYYNQHNHGKPTLILYPNGTYVKINAKPNRHRELTILE